MDKTLDVELNLPRIFDYTNLFDSNAELLSIEAKCDDNRSFDTSLSLPTNELFDRRVIDDHVSIKDSINKCFECARDLPDELVVEDWHKYYELFCIKSGDQSVDCDQNVKQYQQKNSLSPESLQIQNDNQITEEIEDSFERDINADIFANIDTITDSNTTNNRDVDHDMLLLEFYIDSYKTGKIALPIGDDFQSYLDSITINSGEQRIKHCYQNDQINHSLLPQIEVQKEFTSECNASVAQNTTDFIANIDTITTSITTTNKRKRKAGRYSLEEQGFTDEQKKERQREQNRRAQQRRRDNAKASKPNTNESSVNSTHDNCDVVPNIVIEPQNGQLLTEQKIHLFVEALDKSLRATSDNEKHDLILFVINNLKSMLS